MTLLLEATKIYQLDYFHTSNERLFQVEGDYVVFLKQYAELFSPMVETFAFCLLPNSIHLLVRMKEEQELFTFLKSNNRIPEENLSFSEYSNLASGTANLVGNIFSLQINKQLALLLNTFSQERNKNHQLKTNLLKQRFVKNEISSEEQLKQAMISIHCSPKKESLIGNLVDWKFSSFAAYLSDKPSLLNRDYPMQIFDGRENFIAAHKIESDTKTNEIKNENSFHFSKA